MMKNSRFKGEIRQWLEFLELTLFRGVYMWVVKSEDGKELERVAYIVVKHPQMADDIEACLDFGFWREAVQIVADALSFKWKLPSYRAEDGKVREMWKRSRLIRIFDYYPERDLWRVSGYVKQLGLDKIASFFLDELPTLII
jgi:hypothetical protein